MDKVDEMLEGSVEVSFLLKGNDVIKMSMVYVSIHSKQTLQNSLSDGDEVSRKGHTYRSEENMSGQWHQNSSK